MSTILRITTAMLKNIRGHLGTSHPFARERVGFVTTRCGSFGRTGLVMVAAEYIPIDDDEYIDDARYGALIGEKAFRRMLQHTHDQHVGMFHIHLHEHFGSPTFSRIDLEEQARFVPNFFNVRPGLPHGALVLSHDSFVGRIWVRPGAVPRTISRIASVGRPIGVSC